MIVAVHFRSMFSAPGGIWWEQDGILRRHYTDSLLEVAGLSTMLAVVEDVDLAEWFRSLSRRTPYGDVWETAELTAHMSPQEYLELLQRQVGKMLVA